MKNIKVYIDLQSDTRRRLKPFRLRVVKDAQVTSQTLYFAQIKDARRVKRLIYKVFDLVNN